MENNIEKEVQISKKINEILKKENCHLEVLFIPANLFTKIFRKFLRVTYTVIIKKN